MCRPEQVLSPKTYKYSAGSFSYLSNILTDTLLAGSFLKKMEYTGLGVHYHFQPEINEEIASRIWDLSRFYLRLFIGGQQSESAVKILSINQFLREKFLNLDRFIDIG